MYYRRSAHTNRVRDGDFSVELPATRTRLSRCLISLISSSLPPSCKKLVKAITMGADRRLSPFFVYCYGGGINKSSHNVDFLNDSYSIFLGVWDSTIRVWDPVTWKCERLLSDHIGPVYALTVLEGKLVSYSCLDANHVQLTPGER